MERNSGVCLLILFYSGNEFVRGIEVGQKAALANTASGRENATLVGMLLCLPTAPALPPGENGDFGMSPIYGQLSDNITYPVDSHGGRDVKHNRDRKLNADHLLAVRGATRL